MWSDPGASKPIIRIGTCVLCVTYDVNGRVCIFPIIVRFVWFVVTQNHVLETGKALIQTCLNSPDPPPPNRNPDERMSQAGYEETDLAYPVNEDEQDTKVIYTGN